jgi:putative spermidine/putrescine transport system ATP-binding protein
MSFLRLERIHKSFGKTVAVHEFNLSVEAGEFISLLGPSGCGKTTVLRIIAGFERPTTGTVWLQDNDITDQPPNRRRMGMVFQHYALFPNMNAAGNIGFGLRVTGVRREEIQRRVTELLNLIQMADLGDRYPHQLSGGQQQRVALARALAIQPQVLLLDEPLSALDAQIRLELRAEIRRIQQQLGITTIYVTHDQEEALSLSDRIVVMNQGRIEQIGTPFEIYNRPATPFVARFVGAVNQMRCEVLDPLRGQLRYADQPLMLSGPMPPDIGSTTTVMIRPEALHLGERGGTNRLVGRVSTVVFRGPWVRIHLDFGANNTLVLDTLNTPQLTLPRVGETQVVSFAPESVWLMLNGSK